MATAKSKIDPDWLFITYCGAVGIRCRDESLYMLIGSKRYPKYSQLRIEDLDGDHISKGARLTALKFTEITGDTIRAETIAENLRGYYEAE